MAYFSKHFDCMPERSALREAITQKTRYSEKRCIEALLPDAEMTEEEAPIASSIALDLARALRDNRRPGLVETLVQEFSLASDEGVALMSMAEALLRTPDKATRDALISDQISVGDWLSHAGRGQGIIVNAASWGLALTGKVIASEHRMGVVHDTLKRHGEPVVRQAMQVAMQMMGGQFVLGESIERALNSARKREAEGFTYSYDMLGEAALDQDDCEAYQAAYHYALESIGHRATGEGVHERPGLSIKLSALHPRFYRSQRKRVIAELIPTVKRLALRAQHYNIGLNIDAEESDRLELSLDILEALCHDPDLAQWKGIGIVVQAYSRRAPSVLTYIIDLARKTQHRIMVRLVKGAYWDSEIKKAQIDGAEDFPLFTRKSHTDVSYLACARLLLNATDAVFPQFATHNARTVAAIYAMKGDFFPGQYEFQCLHGMGEGLYEEVVGPHKLNRPCRIYAPVGTYDTLLAYLVRRLLENGANSSFINLLGDSSVNLEKLVEDPVVTTRSLTPVGEGHPGITQPKDMFGKERSNSAGMDLADESVLNTLRTSLLTLPEQVYAEPLIPGCSPKSEILPVFNPADRDDQVGTVQNAVISDVSKAVKCAEAAFTKWSKRAPSERASILDRASNLLEQNSTAFLGMAVREAGKSYPNALAELREAVDFLRYYAAQVKDEFSNETHRPLGPVVCISPWNFPLAIFLGQISAALAAGNTVLAKPAEETPLIAMMAIQTLYEAGVPKDVVQYLPGEGDIGAALVADKRISGVMFTGSTGVAQAIARQLSGRLGRYGQPVPLVAETGGVNAMIVDSSALPEQVVTDIVSSAFDSAGQRCSALRLLCVQEEAADRVISLLKGAMAELRIGTPARLETDIGPVISEEAKAGICKHIETLRERKHSVYEVSMTDEAQKGSFVSPTLIEVHSIEDIGQEVFGPVLHVLKYPRRGLNQLVDEINCSGYGLTFGIHSRLSSTINHLVDSIDAGNLYVNRNIVGAIVGVQPFGGRGLSGTGPKAGGPLALRRQLEKAPLTPLATQGSLPSGNARSWLLWLSADNKELAQSVTPWMEHGLLGSEVNLPSPVGESNVYRLKSRGRILALAETEDGLKRIISYALSCGNEVCVLSSSNNMAFISTLPEVLRNVIKPANHKGDLVSCSVIIAEKNDDIVWKIVNNFLADPANAVPLLYFLDEATLRPEFLLEESVVSTNTAAVGGNAQLLSLGA